MQQQLRTNASSIDVTTDEDDECEESEYHPSQDAYF